MKCALDCEQIGPNLGIDWKAAALGHGKNKRKTVGFGEYSKKRGVWSGGVVHIREVSLMSGGFGAAVWDAAIIMARWIYMNEGVFEGKIVHELGCGVGLPGLVAARYAHSVIFSDYLPGILDNMKHNIEVNTNLEFDEESDEEERVQSRSRKERILKATRRLEQIGLSKSSQTTSNQEEGALSRPEFVSSSTDQVASTRGEFTSPSTDQIASPSTQKENDSPQSRVTSSPSSEISTPKNTVETCEPSSPSSTQYQVIDVNWDLVSETCTGCSLYPNVQQLPLADILIGSELTYSPKSIDGLIRTANMYLKPDGVFYEILSTDRDGVSLFVEQIQLAGWSVSVRPVPEVILSGKFNTKQRPETYRLYTFRRSSTSSSYPDFA